MNIPLCCPNCKTNRSCFNLIEQHATAVKLHPSTGEIEQSYTDTDVEPFHMTYNGPLRKVQCASCGLIENEQTFISFASYQK